MTCGDCKCNEQKETILKKALEHWGLEIYIGQTGEEAAELISELAHLIQKLNHYKRERKGSLNELIIEMAHVQLMLDVMRFAIIPSNTDFQEVCNVELLKIRDKYQNDNPNYEHD